jgi:hypothetical protein
MTERELYLHNLYEDICARFRYISRNYPDVRLKDCVIIGNEFDLTYNDYISDVPYIYCATVDNFKLGKCENFKACRDFEDGFKE